MNRYILTFDFIYMEEVMSLIKACNGIVMQNEADVECRLVVEVPIIYEDEFNTRLEDLHDVDVTMEA